MAQCEGGGEGESEGQGGCGSEGERVRVTGRVREGGWGDRESEGERGRVRGDERLRVSKSITSRCGLLQGSSGLLAAAEITTHAAPLIRRAGVNNTSEHRDSHTLGAG